MMRNGEKCTMRVVILAALGAMSTAASAVTMQDLWGAPPAPPPVWSVGSGIPLGSAPIETALSRIIPRPYAIELDERIPTNWIVSWPAGQDWMAVLKQALSPMGIKVVPRWDRNTIQVVLRAAPARTGRAVVLSRAAAAPKVASTPIAPIAVGAVLASSVVPVAALAKPYAEKVVMATSAPAPRPALPAGQGNEVVRFLPGANAAAWESAAPLPPSSPERLSSAILRLLPDGMFDAQIDTIHVDPQARATWGTGQSRLQALTQVLRAARAHARIGRKSVVVESDRPVVADSVPAGPVFGLVQIGAPSGGSFAHAGFGRGVPLRMALQMIMPRSWVSSTLRVDESTPVSWGTGMSWSQDLDQIARDHGWTGTIDWNARMVTIEGPAGAVAPKVVAAHPAAPAAAPAPHFDLQAGLALSPQIIAWGKRAGWTVIWNLPTDWVVPAPSSFSGDFQVAVSNVIQAIAQTGIDVRADLYLANKTAVIHRSASSMASDAK